MVPENLFGIASITKTFVSATILQLVEEGVLTLEDSVEKWLPGLVPNGENITIRHLLNHTSGIPEYSSIFLGEALQNPGRFWQPEEIVAIAQPPDFAPGDNYKYSNTGYIVLGMIIEKATDAMLAQEIRRRFLEPLQLNNTFLGGYEEIEGEVAHGYSSYFPSELLMLHLDSLLTGGWAAGGMVSNAEDLAHWAKSLYAGSVLDQNSLSEMFNLHPIGRYGLGMMVRSTHIGLAYGHNGGTAGAESRMYYFPDKGVTIVVLVNEDSKNTNAIFDAIVSKIPELLAIPAAVSAAGKITTTWGNLKR